MKSTRIPANISFLSEEEKQAAIEKSQQRGRSLSAQIRWYFKNLPSIQDQSDEHRKAGRGEIA